MNFLRHSFTFIAVAAALVFGCRSEKVDTLRTGDLVFVGIPMDYSLEEGSMDEAIASATGNPDSLNLIHVAIAEVDEEGSWRPYDLHFMPTDDSLYCSELVRDCYSTADGVFVFDDAPMNFKDSNGEFPLYWQQLFEKLGSPIPQDLPGTNPQDMSKSPAIVTTKVDLH